MSPDDPDTAATSDDTPAESKGADNEATFADAVAALDAAKGEHRRRLRVLTRLGAGCAAVCILLLMAAVLVPVIIVFADGKATARNFIGAVAAGDREQAWAVADRTTRESFDERFDAMHAALAGATLSWSEIIYEKQFGLAIGNAPNGAPQTQPTRDGAGDESNTAEFFVVIELHGGATWRVVDFGLGEPPEGWAGQEEPEN